MKTRIEELKDEIKHLNDLMSWTPGWLKSEIKDLINYEIELHDLEMKNRP